MYICIYIRLAALLDISVVLTTCYEGHFPMSHTYVHAYVCRMKVDRLCLGIDIFHRQSTR